MSTGYQIYDQAGCYYLTFQIVHWADIFSRKIYKDIVVDSFKYCIEKRDFRLHAYVIMSNHIHLIASSQAGNLSAIVRDFKRHTSKEIIATIERSRKAEGNGCYEYFGKQQRNTNVTKATRYGRMKTMQ